MRRINLTPAKSVIAAVVIGLFVFGVVYGTYVSTQSSRQGQLTGYSPVKAPEQKMAMAGYSDNEADGTMIAKSETGANGGGEAYNDENIVRGISAEQSIQDGYGAGAPAADMALGRPDMPDFNEKIIRTANIEVQVKKGKFDEAYDRAVAVAKGTAGYVSQSKSMATGNSIASGEIVMRIPTRGFEMVISSLKRLGKVKSLDISSEDVSEEYVDLESRLKHWRAQETVMLDLMGRAKSVSESITVQNSLSQIQMEIERISGRLKFLENRTSYAMVRLYIAEPQAIARVDKWGFSSAMRDALHEGLRAGASIVSGVIVLAGYLLPLVLLACLGYGIYRPFRRQLRNTP